MFLRIISKSIALVEMLLTTKSKVLLRKLANKFNPDLHHMNKRLSQSSKKINWAYEVQIMNYNKVLSIISWLLVKNR